MSIHSQIKSKTCVLSEKYCTFYYIAIHQNDGSIIFVFDGDEIVGKIWCFYSDSTENASGFDTGGYDNAVDGLTELYRSGEKVSFTWFGSNLYCCPKNVVSYPIECAVFHKPSVVYLYNAEQGAPIHRNNAE